MIENIAVRAADEATLNGIFDGDYFVESRCFGANDVAHANYLIVIYHVANCSMNILALSNKVRGVVNVHSVKQPDEPSVIKQQLPRIGGICHVEMQRVVVEPTQIRLNVVYVDNGVASIRVAEIAGVVDHQHTIVDGRRMVELSDHCRLRCAICERAESQSAKNDCSVVLVQSQSS